MIYADRNGNRMEKTTGQDRFLEYKREFYNKYDDYAELLK